MNRNSVGTRPLWALSLALVVLLLAACGRPASTPGGGEEVAAEAPATGSEEAAATEAPATEPTATPDVVNQSEATQGKIVGGVVVTSTEDVTTPRDKHGGEYRSSSTSDIVNFHPYLTTDAPSRGAQGNVYDSALLRYDENTLQLVPNMAEGYSVSEDGLTYTFNLRKTLKWSDGEPLTAHDYAWTFEQAIKPENEFPYVSQLEFITSYKALDDYTLEIKIDEIYCPALGQMTGLLTPLPKHIWEKLDWKDPEKNPEINKPTVTSGPYKLQEWVRDQYSIYEANPDYWYHGAPNITRLVDEIVPDADVSYQKMKAGETDSGVITPENLEEARQLDNITVYEWWPAAASWSYIGFNLRREDGPTADVNVRHGVAYALDKDLMTEEIMEGQAKRQCSVYPETSWVYNPDVPCYDYDPEQAKAAFAESGYTFDEGSQQMVGPDGQQLTLKLIYGPNTSKTRELMAVYVQDNLSQLGINVEIQSMEWASFLDAIHTAEPPDWDMFLGGWSSTIEPHIMFTIWAAENIPDLNAVGYDNPTTEALFKEAGQNCDIEFRKEKYSEVQRIIAEDAPYVFLWYQKAWSGQNKRIGGIDPRPIGIGWNFNDWYILEDAGQ